MTDDGKIRGNFFRVTRASDKAYIWLDATRVASVQSPCKLSSTDAEVYVECGRNTYDLTESTDEVLSLVMRARGL